MFYQNLNMAEEDHQHEWSLFISVQDTRFCTKCRRVEVFMNGEWRWEDKWFERTGRKLTDEEISEL